MYIHTYIYIYRYIHTYIYIYMHIYIHLYVHTHRVERVRLDRSHCLTPVAVNGGATGTQRVAPYSRLQNGRFTQNLHLFPHDTGLF